MSIIFGGVVGVDDDDDVVTVVVEGSAENREPSDTSLSLPSPLILFRHFSPLLFLSFLLFLSSF